MLKINKAFFLTVLFSLLSISTLFAQCDDTAPDTPPDPDGNYIPCPLDTWVIVLVAVALIFTVLHLHRKQKTQLI